MQACHAIIIGWNYFEPQSQINYASKKLWNKSKYILEFQLIMCCDALERNYPGTGASYDIMMSQFISDAPCTTWGKCITIQSHCRRAILFVVLIKSSVPSEIHDDVIKWKNFPRNWPFVQGIHRSPVNSLHKGQWRGALMFSLICVWINDWVNNREAGDLRRYCAHYDVIVMNMMTPWGKGFWHE